MPTNIEINTPQSPTVEVYGNQLDLLLGPILAAGGGGGGGLTAEDVRDIIGEALRADVGANIDVDDPNDTITIGWDDTAKYDVLQFNGYGNIPVGTDPGTGAGNYTTWDLRTEVDGGEFAAYDAERVLLPDFNLVDPGTTFVVRNKRWVTTPDSTVRLATYYAPPTSYGNTVIPDRCYAIVRRTPETSTGGTIPVWDVTIVEGDTTATGDHGALAGLSDDDHPQYALSYTTVTVVNANTTLSGAPRPVVATDPATAITMPSTTPTGTVGRPWRIVNSTSGSITLNAGTSGRLFGGVDSTFLVPQYGSISVNAATVGGVNLWGLGDFYPIVEAGGAIGPTNIKAGTGVTVTPGGPGGRDVTIASTSVLPSSPSTGQAPVWNGSSWIAYEANRFVQTAEAFSVDSATADFGSGNICATLVVYATTRAVTVNLPSIVGRTGHVFVVARHPSSTFNVVIDPNGSEEINDASTLTLDSTKPNAYLTTGSDVSDGWIAVVGGGGGGTGDVVGPASSTDGRAVLFDGTTGKLLKQASAAPMLVGDAPTAHAASHASAGSDAITIAQSQVTNLTTDLAGKVGTSDSRLTDARTPTDGSVTNAKVSASAAIDVTKLATSTRGTALTSGASANQWTRMRPIGGGVQPITATTVSTVAIASTVPQWCGIGNQGANTSGRIVFVPILLDEGETINNIAFVSGTTALATGTHQWFTLCNDSLVSVVNTVNDTSTAWGANTRKSLATTASYTTTYRGRYFVGCCIVATTMPTMRGIAATSQGIGYGAFAADSGLTTPPAVGNAYSTSGLASANILYAEVL